MYFLNLRADMIFSPKICNYLVKHAKKFCSVTTVWESCYKVVVTPQVVSVFIPFDLTKWNRFHCWPNLVSSMYYQRKKRRKQIESWCGTGITNQRKSVWNNFQYLMGRGGVGNRSSTPPTSANLHSNPAFLDTPGGLQKRSPIALSLPLLQGFPLHLSISNFSKIIWIG